MVIHTTTMRVFQVRTCLGVPVSTHNSWSLNWDTYSCCNAAAVMLEVTPVHEELNVLHWVMYYKRVLHWKQLQKGITPYEWLTHNPFITAHFHKILTQLIIL